jgi:hypothetical protein
LSVELPPVYFRGRFVFLPSFDDGAFRERGFDDDGDLRVAGASAAFRACKRLFDDGTSRARSIASASPEMRNSVASTHPGRANASRTASFTMPQRCLSRCTRALSASNTCASNATDVTNTKRPSLRIFARS